MHKPSVWATGSALLLALQAMFGSIAPVRGADEKAIRPGLHEFAVKVGKTERPYLFHVPKSYDGTKALPLVMMLHGGGGTGTSALEETGWSHKAEEKGFLAVFPSATRPDPMKPPKFGGNSPLWNDGSGRGHAGRRNVPDIDYLEAVLDDVAGKSKVDHRRIYVTGFSNGASMTFRAGVELSHRLAAIAPVAGAFWLNDPNLKTPVPTLYITGTADTLNPMAGGFPRFARGRRGIGGRRKPSVWNSIRRWADLLGCPKEPMEVREDDGVKTMVFGPGRNGVEMVFITVEKMGHVWPGGRNKLPAFMIGTDPNRLRATDLIWDFFKSHARLPGN